MKNRIDGLRQMFALCLAFCIGFVPAYAYATDSFQFRRPTDGVSLGEIDTAGNVVFRSSHTASSYYGSGAALTGITATSVAAAGVQAGTLGAAVIASSVAASGVTAGSFGSATQTGAFTVGGDGRLSSASNTTITPAAGSITAGTLGAAVIASSVAASGVAAGSFGSATQAGTFTVGGDGRLSSAASVTMTPAAGSVAAGTFSGSFTFSSALTVGSTGLDIRGSATNTTICSASCAGGGGRCMYLSSTDFDFYSSTGSGAGDWRNGRTGIGACP